MRLCKILASLVLILSSFQGQAIEPKVSDENTIYVRTTRRERFIKKSAGYSLVVKPDEASRYQSDELLRENASFLLQESGQVVPSGFAIPRIRGQDQKLTEIWLDDLLIYDPYTGLPLLTPIDLQAFGQLEIYQGVSPIEVPSLNPIGAILYRQRPMSAWSLRGGAQVGKPYGHSEWLHHHNRYPLKEGYVRYSLFTRKHQTDGRYPFYDDHGNPFHTKDATISWRENNFQDSVVFIPLVYANWKNHALQLLAMGYQGRQGLAGYGAFLSRARQDQKETLASLAYHYNFSPPTAKIQPTQLSIGSYLRSSAIITNDPFHPLLQLAIRQDTEIVSRHHFATLVWQGPRYLLQLRSQLGSSSLNYHLNHEQRIGGIRYHRQAQLSQRVAVLPSWTIEGKFLYRQHAEYFGQKDKLLNKSSERTTPSSTSTSAYSLANLWDLHKLLAYFQLGQYHRPVSLWEEFGDGGNTLPSLDLKPELILHSEAGVRAEILQSLLQLNARIFEDQVSEKIVMIPAFAAKFRAVNLQKTNTRGFEIGADWHYKNTEAMLSLALLSPKNITDTNRHKNIPQVPNNQTVVTLNQKFAEYWTVRGRSRYRSATYRDVDNSLMIPAVTLFDAFLDYSFHHNHSRWQAGLSLLNLCDTKKVAISSPVDHATTGFTALSDLDGYPLPARQWLFHFILTL